jgi:hypothetical protein
VLSSGVSELIRKAAVLMVGCEMAPWQGVGSGAGVTDGK